MARVEVLRQQVVDAAIQGCTMAIVTPAVTAFMKRSQDAGKPIATEAEALAQIESTPQWKSMVFPGIQRTCACAMEDRLRSVRAASTASDLNSAVSQLAQLTDPARLEELKPLLVRCTQENFSSPAGKQ
jgi:hypothetical protein